MKYSKILIHVNLRKKKIFLNSGTVKRQKTEAGVSSVPKKQKLDPITDSEFAFFNLNKFTII